MKIEKYFVHDVGAKGMTLLWDREMIKCWIQIENTGILNKLWCLVRLVVIDSLFLSKNDNESETM